MTLSNVAITDLLQLTATAMESNKSELRFSIRFCANRHVALIDSVSNIDNTSNTTPHKFILKYIFPENIWSWIIGGETL